MRSMPSLRTIVFVLIALLGLSIAPLQAQVENPQGGSVGIDGDVPGPPPETSATINVPINGQVFTSLPISVSGTCEVGTIVEIYKNEVFAGAVECVSSNTYAIEVDLFIGENELIARVRDLLGQAGPDSNPVTVVYNPPVEQSNRQLPAQQLLLSSETTFRGGAPLSEFSFPINLSGGIGPYAIGIVWGDGSSDVLSRSDTGRLNLRHTYEVPGVYRVVIKATDESGSVAFLQMVAVVNGDSAAGEGSGGPTRIVTEYILWPLFIALLMLPLAFWFGLRYQKSRFGR